MKCEARQTTRLATFASLAVAAWRRSFTSILLTLMITLTWASAQVPALFNYQGRVTVGGTDFEGTGAFKFALVNGGSNIASQATAMAMVTNGFITGVVVTHGGAGYTAAPAVTVTDPAGAEAVLVAQVSGGVVTGIRIDNAGYGYTRFPTLTIAPPPPTYVYVTYWSHDNSSTSGSEPVSAVSLPVAGGLFSVNLGDTSVPNMTAALSPWVFTNSDVCLRLWFNDGVSGFRQLTPDQRITSAAYAFRSADAETLGGFGWDAFFNSENPLTGQINANRLVPDSISSGQIGIGAVVNDGLADGSVTTAKIADGQVTSADIQDGTIAGADLAPNSVTSSKIADGQVTSADIANGTIQSGDIGTMNRLTGSDGSTAVYVGANNYVGINTTSPGTTLDVNGAVIVNGSLNYPPASPGPFPTFGDHTVPLYDGNNEIWFRWVTYPDPLGGNKLDIMVDDTRVKTFVIPHPADPGQYLVHGTLEGPEAAVFYRGQGRLEQGRSRISLPPFFEALTRQDGRTVQLTPVDGFDRLAVSSQDGVPVKNGVLEVYSDNPASTQAFMWEVKAVRADVSRLEVEVPKTAAAVRGDGPYTYLDRPKVARAGADQSGSRQP